MTPEQWQRAREVLADALELKPSERPIFLDGACFSDKNLRREVERLLASSEEARSSFMESSPLRVTLMAGVRLGDYEVVKLLGSGGMGEVYRARDTRLAREVAIKVLPAFYSNDPDRLRRFEQEARAAAALNHPNILAVHQMGTYEGAPYLVSELLEGNTLRELLVRGPLALRRVIDYGVQIARGLAAAHEKGVVHRDLKPENLFITKDGRAKILDFGLAKLTQPQEALNGTSAATTEITEPGVVMGTVGYMSPEQVSGKPADRRADIFALGAILYEALTGKRAFQRPTAPETMSAILNEDPPTASQFAPTISPALQKVVHRCLEKNPAQRFQSASDLAFALEALSDSGVQATVSKRLNPGRLAWMIALLAVGGVVGAIWITRSTHKTPESTFTAVPFVTYPGFQGLPTFSPDGNQVAFSWNGDKQDNFDIYVKLIGTGGPPLRLTFNPAYDYSPSWSPDGRFIAFLRDLSPEKSAVLLIPALGGPERKIAEIFSPSMAFRDLPSPNLAWSPDGKWLAVTDRDSATAPYALSLLSVETGEKQKVTSPPTKALGGDSDPAFSPDGKVLAFSRLIDFGIGDLYLLNLSSSPEGLKPTGEAARVTFDNRGATGPAWSPDGREVVFSKGGGEVWRIDVASRGSDTKPRPIASLGAGIYGVAISRRGQRLAYVHLIFHSSIRRIAASFQRGSPRSDQGGNSKALNPVSFISSTRNDSAPQYSEDGKRITFMSGRSGFEEIWSCDSDGANPQQLTSFGGPEVTTPRWSPDGSRIAFDSDAGGQYDIWVVDINGGAPHRMTNDPANDGNPSWSRDGHWIYFDSARTGQQQVWKVPANGGNPVQVTFDGGFAPVESPDGKFIYYLKGLMNTDLWRISTDGGGASKVLEKVSEYRDLAVLEDGLLFVSAQNTSSLQFLSFATGKISSVANFDRPISLDAIGGIGVSPDRRWILYTQFEQAGSELMLVDNFR